jgi:hypothetical protein
MYRSALFLFTTLCPNFLKFTDLAANVNKYYGMEIHQAKENGKNFYRIYTTYGKTDELLDHSEGIKNNRKIIYIKKKEQYIMNMLI